MRARHFAAPQPVVRERLAREDRLRPSARDLFPVLRDRLHMSRPLLGLIDEGKPTEREILGPPTFRNVIDENGRHI
ncbi:hypothetical protein [Microbacterium sp. p3-SID131]|uniref:hypothetical protein n=1 Tax=Microbacterium sp. p3-SID131 TaxID=2916215 RepID=UPI0021A84F58|nr:hypothetical protein [Microbacterium sp. p3-SID131]MCT1363923.1 hypothetical protein [Microbacterium sp. p3-SID131]